MQISDFQFINPSMRRLDFMVNTNFKNDDTFEGIAVNIEVGHNVITPYKVAYVSVILRIGKKDDTQPFYLETEFASRFKNESGNEAIFKKLIEQNAPAMLVSYARPIISLITAQGGFPAFNLPFINFSVDKGL